MKGDCMDSIWTLNCKIEKRSSLHENIHTDVAVIGAGMAGILIAYFLMKNGIECVVLEGDRIGSGQTKNTTAKITSQHALKYNKLIDDFGEEKARQYAAANQKAIAEYFRIAKAEKSSCMLEEMPAYLYSKNDIVQI